MKFGKIFLKLNVFKKLFPITTQNTPGEILADQKKSSSESFNSFSRFWWNE